jgi:DNA-binding CsgD family transcriptional regulator
MSKRLLTVLIALTFFWAGSVYINQMYYLSDKISANAIDLISIQLNYSGQMIGAIIGLFMLRKDKTHLFIKRNLFLGLIISVVTTLGIFASTKVIYSVLLGFIMNSAYGFITAYLLSLVGQFGTVNTVGKIVGLGYGLGTLASYLFNAILGEWMSQYQLISFVFAGIILIEIFIVHKMNLDFTQTERPEKRAITRNEFFLMAFVLTFMAIISAIGGNYKSEAIFQTGIRLEYTRIYYAIGLIIAGLISDYSRHLGGWACIFALFYPFVGILINSNLSLASIAWPMSYFFLGFYTIYRTIKSIDLSMVSQKFIYFASLGFIVARFGEIMSELFFWIPSDQTLLNSILLILLMVPMLIGFTKLESYTIKNTNLISYDDKVKSFALTNREKEILECVLNGKSNSEIASSLFISENTVKFHVRNILKKTNCKGRNDVRDLFH